MLTQIAAAAAALLAVHPAAGKPAAPPRPLPAAVAQTRIAPPVESRPGDTPRFNAARNAASRAHFTCGGLFNSRQPPEQLDRGGRPADPLNLKTEVDLAARTVSVTYAPDMPPRIVVWKPIIGCIELPAGAGLDLAEHLPSAPADMTVPDYDDQPWPMGDRDARGNLPPARQAALDALIARAFDGTTYAGRTWGVIVIKDGRILGERYGLGFDAHMGARTHSVSKSFAASLIGIGVKEGRIRSLDQGPVLQAWSRPGDPRGRISFADLMHMASGLYTEGSGNPMPDVYESGALVAERLSANVLDSMPGQRFFYSPPDTMLAMRALREAMDDEARWPIFPYTALFWKIGMTRTVTDMDWNGDFLMSGVAWSTARDLARFGLLYMNDGVWNGERILPEGWAKYVATPGPAQPPKGWAGYGAFFWLHGGAEGLPMDAFTPNGSQGQYVMIIPSRRVIVVRRGFDEAAGFRMDAFTADVLKVLDGA